MEAKTMTSEMGRGPAEPAPVTTVDGGHVRLERPGPTWSGATSAPADGPSAEPPAEPPAGPSVGSAGDERVDEALARLHGLGGVPVARHVEVFEDVHRRLQEVLAGIDQDDRDPAGPPVPRPRPPGGPAGTAGQAGLWPTDGPGGG
jgi:hypothetical protein